VGANLPPFCLPMGTLRGARAVDRGQWKSPGVERGLGTSLRFVILVSRNLLPRIKTTGHDSVRIDSYSRSEIDTIRWPAPLSVAEI
jgi:hypothetical protein